MTGSGPSIIYSCNSPSRDRLFGEARGAMTMLGIHRRKSICALFASAILTSCTHQAQAPQTGTIPAHAVVGVQQKQLQPEFWIARDSQAARVVLEKPAIAERNARLLKLDPSVHDLEAMPAALTAAQVRGWLSISSRPDEDMFDSEGHKLGASQIDE